MSKDTPSPKKLTPTPEYVRGLENLTTAEAAVYTRYSESTLNKLRHFSSDGPVYIRLSARKIIYRRADLDAWMATRAFASTSAASVGIVSEVAA